MTRSSHFLSIIAAGAAVLCLVTPTAHAGGGDDPRSAARYSPEPPLTSWSGLYVGANLGYAVARTTWTNFTYSPTDFLDINTGDRVPIDLRGGLAGGHVGINYQFRQWVVGAEVSYSRANIKGRVDSTHGADDDVDSSKIESILIAAVRLGYVWDRFLVYGKAGYAIGRVKTRAEENGDDIGSASSSDRHHGHVLGAGIEYMLTPNLVLGIEYDYLKLKDKVHTLPAFDDGVFAGDITNRVQLDGIHAIMARLSYKFGR